jgi:hypothetical protein
LALKFGCQDADPFYMEPVHIQSEDALFSYLKKFLKSKPDAVQLDGSTKPTTNKKVILVFTYSVTGQMYKITGDFTRAAAQRFVELVQEHGSPALVLKEYRLGEKEEGLILGDSDKTNGFRCIPYVSKASSKLKKVS